MGKGAVPVPNEILSPEVLSVQILNNRFFPRSRIPLSPPGPTREAAMLMSVFGIQTEDRVAI